MGQKRYAKRLGMLAGAFLAVILYRMALADSAFVWDKADTATILLEDRKLDVESAQKLRSEEMDLEEPLEFACWGEAGNIAVESPGNGGRRTVSLVFADEGANLVVPGAEMLAWQEDGCFLDRETAWQLFGQEQAGGQPVWCGGRLYTVCGTFESFRGIMLCRAKKEDKEVFSAISCRVPDRMQAAACAKEFMVRHSIEGKSVDFVFLSCLCRDLLLLSPLCLGIRFWQMLSDGAAAKKKRERKVPFFIWRLIIAAALFLFVWGNIRIPADMIPSRWSDFSFWGTWWEKQRSNLLCLLQMAQGETQTAILWSFVRSVCESVGSAACLLLFIC